jgi:hypothetical protein
VQSNLLSTPGAGHSELVASSLSYVVTIFISNAGSAIAMVQASLLRRPRLSNTNIEATPSISRRP